MKNKNFKRIYYLTNSSNISFYENFWSEEVACLTETEIENLFQDYSIEEIKDIQAGRRIAGNYTYEMIDKYVSERGEGSQNLEVNLYSKFYLPIELTHTLVKSGIKTVNDLLLISEEEIYNIKGITLEEYETIKKELESKKMFLKGSNDVNRLFTIQKLKEQINNERIENQRRIEELEKIKEQIKAKIEEEIYLIDELDSEQINLINNSQNKNIKILKRVLNEAPKA